MAIAPAPREIYALLSALSELPIRQDIAVTGSVNQQGVIQPIGGVNEKIEGFYDVCRVRGLTGTQGVLIPVENVEDLMLRDDVIEAVAAGKFHVHPVAHIEEGIEILTGSRGRFPRWPRTISIWHRFRARRRPPAPDGRNPKKIRLAQRGSSSLRGNARFVVAGG